MVADPRRFWPAFLGQSIRVAEFVWPAGEWPAPRSTAILVETEVFVGPDGSGGVERGLLVGGAILR